MDTKRQRETSLLAEGQQVPFDEDEWADRLAIARARREKVLEARGAQKQQDPEAASAARLKSALRSAKPASPAAARPVPSIRAERRGAEPEPEEVPVLRPRHSRRGKLYMTTLLIGVAVGSVATVKVMDWLEDEPVISAPAVAVDPAAMAITPAAPAPATPVVEERQAAASPETPQEPAPVVKEPAAAKPDAAPVAQTGTQTAAAEETGTKVAAKPAAKADKPPAKPAAEAASPPKEKPASAPAKPADPVTTEAAATASREKPAAQPPDAVAAKPAEKPAEPKPETAEAEKPKVPPSDSTVRIYAPRSVAQGELDTVGTTLRDAGIVKQSSDRVGYNVGESQVRYYHKGDAGEARRIATAMKATPRDFTSHQPAPAEGTLEVYLAGTSPGGTRRRSAPQPPLAEATAAVQSFVNNLAAQIRQR
jgi:hypothetical protein